jgi:hypothetical protein
MPRQSVHELAVEDNWILFSFALLSLICTVLTFLIIQRMKLWNGYMLIVISMVCFQFMYDLSFLIRVAPGYQACLTWQAIGNMGGLGVSFWTNVLALVVVFVLVNIKSISIYKSYKWFFIFSAVFPVGFGILSIFAMAPSNDDDDGKGGYLYCHFKPGDMLADFVGNFYYWTRIASILFNIGAFVFSYIRLEKLGSQPFVHSALAHSTFSTFGLSIKASNETMKANTTSAATAEQHPLLRRDCDPQHMALATLVRRMQYYPLCQSICRIAPAWAQFDGSRYRTPAIGAIAAVSSPSLGIFLFVIFLVRTLLCRLLSVVCCCEMNSFFPSLSQIMQPKAWETFKEFIGLQAIDHEDSTQNANPFTLTRISDIGDLPEDALEEIIDFDIDRRRESNLISTPNPLYGNEADDRL